MHEARWVRVWWDPWKYSHYVQKHTQTLNYEMQLDTAV